MTDTKKSVDVRFADALPNVIREKYDLVWVDVVKLGFIHLSWEAGTEDRRPTKDRNSNWDHAFVSELFEKLGASPNIMEIKPSEEELLRDQHGLTALWPENSPGLSTFLDLRIVLPQKRRHELFHLFPWTWNPDEFHVWFDGGVFATQARAPLAPLSTDLGQVGREFLKETLRNSRAWSIKEGYGPTPVHPEIYIVGGKPKTDADEAVVILPYIGKVDRDLVIVVHASIDGLMPILLQQIATTLRQFYLTQITGGQLSYASSDLAQQNSNLDSLLSRYLSLPFYRRLLDKIPSEIRRCLAAMHSSLQEITALEAAHRSQEQDTARSIRENMLLSPLQEYFEESMRRRFPIDKESQLTVMHFAAEETKNLATVQATLIAAIIGGVVGGLITLASGLLVGR